MEYFMSELQDFEVELLYENLKYADRPSWEQTRLIMYILAQTNSKKKLNIEDILRFPWDNESKGEENIEDTKENRDKLRERAKQFESILKA